MTASAVTTAGKCDHCSARANERFAWELQACANKRRRNKFQLCHACDVELNQLVLEFFNHKKARELCDAYAAKVKKKAATGRGDLPVSCVPLSASNDGRPMRRRRLRQ